MESIESDVKKDDVSEGDVKKDDVKKDDVSEGDVKKDDVKKDDVKKDNVKKDELDIIIEDVVDMILYIAINKPIPGKSLKDKLLSSLGSLSKMFAPSKAIVVTDKYVSDDKTCKPSVKDTVDGKPDVNLEPIAHVENGPECIYDDGSNRDKDGVKNNA